jgi:hypothetical protein
VIEKSGGFGGGKAQVAGAQFGQLGAGAQPGQGQRGILAGGKDQVHWGGQVFEQKGEDLVHRRGLNYVVVVQDEDERGRERGKLIEQRRQQRFSGRGRGGLEAIQHACANLWGSRP